jgi:hypothetical protein
MEPGRTSPEITNLDRVKGTRMGLDRDVTILAWLNRRPSGFARASELVAESPAELADLDSLERRGLISRVPPRGPDDALGFVITPAGKAFQQGD